MKPFIGIYSLLLPTFFYKGKDQIYGIIISLIFLIGHIAFKYFPQLCPHLPFTSHYSYSNSNHR